MNWKGLLKVIAGAAAGAAIKTAVDATPVVQSTKYGSILTAALIVGGAYATKSPFWVNVIQTAVNQAVQGQEPAKPPEEKK